MTQDPRAIDALRTARYLLDRYAEVVQKAQRATDLPPFVQQANDLYPRIWEHLKAARALVDDPTACARFDQLAESAGDTVSGGMLDAEESRRYVPGTGMLTTQKVSAFFNQPGFAAASESWQLLSALSPGMDWGGGGGVDVDAEIARLNRGSWRGKLPLLILLLAIAAPIFYLLYKNVAANGWWTLIAAVVIFAVAFGWALFMGIRFRS
jgi:hypothetical protein